MTEGYSQKLLQWIEPMHTRLNLGLVLIYYVLLVQLTDPVRLQMRETLRTVYGIDLHNSYNARVTKSWDQCQIAVSIVNNIENVMLC